MSPDSPEPRFAADAMLGRLARWLRFLGYDTWFRPHVPDRELVRRAWSDRRILLTRDTGIPREWTLERVVLVRSERPLEQLAQVIAELGLPWRNRPLARCTVCNASLIPSTRDEVTGRVPPYVARTQDRFALCPQCGRIYWEGTHVERMRRSLEHALAPGTGLPHGP